MTHRACKSLIPVMGIGILQTRHVWEGFQLPYLAIDMIHEVQIKVMNIKQIQQKHNNV